VERCKPEAYGALRCLNLHGFPAALRSKLADHHAIERLALQPTSVTIFGAAVMLGTTPREVGRMIRSGALDAARGGRHLHLRRDELDAMRKAPR